MAVGIQRIIFVIMSVIKSKKFILRPYKKGDEMSIIKYAHDKIIAKNTLTMPYPYTSRDAKDWVKRNLAWNKNKDSRDFVLAIEIDGEVCGAVGLSKIEKGHKAELGYWLGRKYWGQGIMTEAVKLMTKHAFCDLKLRRIYAHVFLFNEPSKRVLEKAGYKLEGVIKKEAKKGNKLIDCYLMAKVC